jgi:hypothetical protein
MGTGRVYPTLAAETAMAQCKAALQSSSAVFFVGPILRLPLSGVGRRLPLPRRPAGATPRCTHLRLPGRVSGAGHCKASHFVAPSASHGQSAACNCSLIAHPQGGRSTLDRCARGDSAARRRTLANFAEESRYRDRARVRPSDILPRAVAGQALQTLPSRDLTRWRCRHIETPHPQNVVQRTPQQSLRTVFGRLSWLHENTRTCRPNNVLFRVPVHHTEARSTVFQ